MIRICKSKRFYQETYNTIYFEWKISINGTLDIVRISNVDYDNSELPNIEDIKPIHDIIVYNKITGETSYYEMLYDLNDCILYRHYIGGYYEYSYVYKENIKYEIDYSIKNLDYINNI